MAQVGGFLAPNVFFVVCLHGSWVVCCQFSLRGLALREIEKSDFVSRSTIRASRAAEFISIFTMAGARTFNDAI